jgi:hypothetical protein
MRVMPVGKRSARGAMVVLLLVPQKIPQDVNTRELHAARRWMDWPNRESIPLPKPIDRRAGHPDPFWEVIKIDNCWQLARESGSVFPFSLA